ncbi:cell wall hydrolase [Magnetovibrio blakemorei]|uniref:Cell wall hydrolase SleB domain-containing protein n=1 Tax=Magnetovibrio blakemorei TaxID=28181 RepID=A0A1E5Q3Z7_9PROT|nr:cell wall hydrolase [Magnetovibrio blakemorei]OEJ64646.1 hypothetical protein BEN30_00715 [Magnetovibrio blakemorei]
MNEAQLVLARTAYGEARGEGYAGMQAVANVVMRRATLGGWWGDSVISVCMKKAQFTAWNQNDPNAALIRTKEPNKGDALFDLAYEIAGLAIAGDLPDVTGGATHYYNPRIVTPTWISAFNETAVVGQHRFGVA